MAARFILPALALAGTTFGMFRHKIKRKAFANTLYSSVQWPFNYHHNL